MYTITKKPWRLSEQLIENTAVNGDILCIECEIGYFKTYELKTFVSDREKSSNISLETLKCGVCEYIVIDDVQALTMRAQLNEENQND